jgi:hypothetical protein
MMKYTAVVILVLAVPLASRVIAVEDTSPRPKIQIIKADDLDATTLRKLAQEVTYEARQKTVKDILADLSKKTGLPLVVGTSLTGWRVSESRMSIFVKDTPLLCLMNSMARSMKFTWTRKCKDGVWIFSLFEDARAEQLAQRESDNRKMAANEKRRRLMDRFLSVPDMPHDELEKLRDAYPQLYLYQKFGVPDSLAGLFREVPAVREAWVTGDKLTIAVSTLPPAAQRAAADLARSLQSFNTAVFNRVTQPDRNAHIPQEDIESQLGYAVINVSEPPDWFGSIEIYARRPAAESAEVRAPIYASLWFHDPDDKRSQYWAKSAIKAVEENRPMKEVFAELQGELTQALKDGDPDTLRPGEFEEAKTETPDDPVLQSTIKMKPKGLKFDDCLSALAEASGYAVVAGARRDNVHSMGQINYPQHLGLEGNCQLGWVLDRLSGSSNWELRDSVIEMRNRHWYYMRQAMIPEATLEKWRNKLRSSGTLDIDYLAEIASVKEPQFSAIYSDALLGMGQGGQGLEEPEIEEYLAGVISQQGDFLKTYGALSPAQRKLVFTGSGLDLGALDDRQFSLFEKLFLKKNAMYLQNPEARIVLRGLRTKTGKRFEYLFKCSTDAGEPPIQWAIKTPKYNEAARKQDVSNQVAR